MRSMTAIMMLLVAAVGAVAAGCGSDDEGSGQPETTLLVQTAGGGGFAGSGEALTLTLRPVSDVTTAFSERPGRDSGAVTTAGFVASFDEAFGDDPPNATLSSLERPRGEFTLELADPRYDAAARTLVYAARPIGDQRRSDLPARLGPVSVFIDGTTDVQLHYRNESNDEPSSGFFVVVSGTVTDESGGAVDGATVTLTPGGLSVDDTTGASGDYEIDAVLPFEQTVQATVTATGFQDLNESLPFPDDDETPVSFTLQRSP